MRGFGRAHLPFPQATVKKNAKCYGFVLPCDAGGFDESAALGALQDARTEEQSKNFVSGIDDLVRSYRRESDPARWLMLALP